MSSFPVILLWLGERGDVDKNIVENWKEKLPKLYEGYEPKNIFNMDETGVFFKDTTRKTFQTLKTIL
jgi:hypothetical protein